MQKVVANGVIIPPCYSNYAGNRLKKGGRIIIRARGSNNGDLGDGDLEEDEGKYCKSGRENKCVCVYLYIHKLYIIL